MVAFLTDEDFNGGLFGESFCAAPMWILFVCRTMPRHVRERLAAGSHIPGVFIVDDLAPIGACIEDIMLVLECSAQGEWEDQMHYIPFK